MKGDKNDMIIGRFLKILAYLDMCYKYAEFIISKYNKEKDKHYSFYVEI